MLSAESRPVLKRGDVVYVPFTYGELSGGKARHAFILSTESYHREYTSVVLVGITTQVDLHEKNTTAHVLTDWQVAGLKAPSVVYPHILTLSPAVVGRRIGQFSERDLVAVEEKLRLSLGL